ncbi:MAG: 1-phosphofructokinase [Elusimicrobiota bacterium]|jgi:1-phosphofructokinase|nr:1-phosphofructokinase [Elusimicrobiota bacterium]
MIITVTLNPALDKTAAIETLQVGKLNRLQNVISDAGGKGINVSKMIAALGGSSLSTGFAGAHSGEEIIQKLNELKIENDFVKIKGATRTNLKIIDKDSNLTELNESGPQILADEIVSLSEKINSLAKDGNIFIFSGSIPKGLSVDIYARFIKAVHKNGALAFLDADGDVFKEALKEKPDFIKPNLHEMKEYFGIKKDLDLKEIASLCGRFLDLGVKIAALTMGGDGALILDGKQTLYAKPLKVPVKSTVGAGDSFVGAFSFGIENNMTIEESFSLSIAASAGAVTTEGTKPPNKDLVNELKKQVVIERIL